MGEGEGDDRDERGREKNRDGEMRKLKRERQG